MDIQITARHFKARESLLAQIEASVQKLAHIYDGIVNAEVILEVEPHTDGKIVEMILMVYHDRLFAKETSEEFERSLNACEEKLERQLVKYKEKLQKESRRQRTELLPEDEDLL